MTVQVFKRSLILFWSVWLSIVFATNLADALKSLGLLDEQWQFASGNYAFMASTTARYSVPGWANAILFAGVILWELLATILFWLLWWETRSAKPACAKRLYPALLSALMLWAAFAIAYEVLIIYAQHSNVESTHFRLFIAQLVTLLAVVLLPEATSS